jgi:hypothetical protein
MRRFLRIVFSRYGIVVVILLLVVGVIALAQSRENTPLTGLNSGQGDNSNDQAPSEQDTFDDGIATPDCEVVDCDDPDSPFHDPYETPELPDEAVDRAIEFTSAWLETNGRTAESWYQGIQPYMTRQAADLMEGVEPDSVPASEIVGEAESTNNRVYLPLDTGTLILTMTENENSWGQQGWMVSAIDWEPA